MFFSVLVCKAMALRIPINHIWGSTWVSHQPGVCSHPHSLWGFLGPLFLNIQWPPSHQACAKTCWPDTLPVQMPSLSIHLYHQALDGVSPKLILWRSVGGFSGQHPNLKNINQSKDEQYNEYYMPTTSILPLTFYCSCHKAIHLSNHPLLRVNF